MLTLKCFFPPRYSTKLISFFFFFFSVQIAAMKEVIHTESGTPGHDPTTLETTCLNVCVLAMERESGPVNPLVRQCLPVHLSLD